MRQSLPWISFEYRFENATKVAMIYFSQKTKNTFMVYEIMFSLMIACPLSTGRRLNVHKTIRRRPGRLLNILCTFNLYPVFKG